MGRAALPFLLLAGAVAHLQLSTANYVEHYGLLRRRGADGRREPVAAAHSWNSAAWLSNAMLLNLARHADHHAEAARPFHRLRHLPEAPQLPAGYPAMFTLAYLPPLWFRVMDRRVWAAAGGDPERIHLDPRHGARALARLRAADARPGATDACPRRWRACGEPAVGRVPRAFRRLSAARAQNRARPRPESGA
ncbi:MAG: fatty acid desaturase [Xanthomonadales bacterium]|nr:fatty acid desaturase [Xanthomonadales bacterium]